MSWFFGGGGSTSAEDDGESDSSRHYPPPSITGCSTVNFTNHESLEETYAAIQRAFDLASGKPHEKPGRSYTGVLVPFEVVPDSKAVLGNALVAKEAVPEGTRIWEDWHHVRISTESRKKYYRFLESIESLHHQCLVLSMTHPSYDGRYLEVTMDQGNYIQDALTKEQLNLDIECVATRDIAAGERFYMNFTEYVGYEQEIEWFDDLKYEAFRDSKLRGGGNTNNNNNNSPSTTVTSWSDRPRTSRNKTSAAAAATANGYPSLLWPTLMIVVTLFAVKKAATTSRKDGLNKNKFC